MENFEPLYCQATMYELQKWLEKVYGGKSCPILDPKEHDIVKLLELKTKNEEAEKHVKEVIKTKKQLTEFYKTMNLEMENLLQTEGVNLPNEVAKQIEIIAELAVKLDLKEPDETNFLLSICDLKTKLIEKKAQLLKDSLELSKLDRNIAKIEKQNSTLKRESEVLENIVKSQTENLVRLEEGIKVNKTKYEKYQMAAEKLEENLAKAKFEPSLRHNSLVQENEENQKLEKELEKLSDILEQYRDLPPNLDLVKLEVQKKKEELAKLDAISKKSFELYGIRKSRDCH